MAQATVTITYDDFVSAQDSDQHSQWMYGTIAIQASPATYATGGLGTGITGSINWVVGDFPKVFTLTPKDVLFYSAGAAGSTIGGFGYNWNKASNKFMIMAAIAVVAGTGPTQQEMTTGTAIPANVSNDVIRFEARWSKSL